MRISIIDETTKINIHWQTFWLIDGLISWSLERKACLNFITLLSVQLSFYGPSEYKSGMLKKLHMETKIRSKLPTSHYILRAYVAE